MGKGKGRQAGAFASKSMRAQFQQEWTGSFNEETARRRKQQKKQAAQKRNTTKERPKILLNPLRNLLESRQFDDRVEHTSIRQKHHSSKKRVLSLPGSALFFRDESFACDFKERKIPTLQLLSLKTLAHVLSEYLDQLGLDELHQYLSFLDGPALSALSVLVSESVGMSNSFLYVIGSHSHLTRLSIKPPPNDDETDGNWKALTSEGLRALVPSWGHQTHIPDNWEEDSQEELEWKGCIRLQRLELISSPHLSAEVLCELLDVCRGISHLSLSGSLEFSSGPEIVWKLPNLLPNLQYIDLSGNAWVTENLIRNLLEKFNLNQPQILQVNVAGCLPPTHLVSLQLDYGEQIFEESQHSTF